jgi:hypothetical protein
MRREGEEVKKKMMEDGKVIWSVSLLLVVVWRL